MKTQNASLPKLQPTAKIRNSRNRKLMDAGKRVRFFRKKERELRANQEMMSNDGKRRGNER